jgi:putative ABC transport system permease protein
MTHRGSLFERSYRAAMLIFPRAFRARYADEMSELAFERVAAARAGGRIATLRIVVDLFADLLRAAPAQWTTGRAVRSPQLPLPAPYPRDNMDILLQDLRFAVRSLARRPAFTIIAALTLALGIGANTAIFSVVNAVLLRPLPYRDPDQLVVVWGTQGTDGGQGVVYADYVDWRARNRTFSEMGAVRGQSVTMTGGDTPERLIGSFVSASLLRVVDAKVAQGRAFTDAETELATKAPVAMLSHEAWMTHFGGAPGMVGRVLTINGTTFTVIGVLAPHTQIPLGTPEVMVPVGYYPNAKGLERGTRGIAVAARLKPGVTIDAAQRDLSAIAKQLEQEYPATNAATGAQVVSLREQLVGNVRESLLIILGAVLVVLLIACANVANLQLARGAARGRELSVRAALGAGRTRIAQQLLTESVVLALVGGIAGLALAYGLTKVLVALVGPQLPVEATDIRLDLPVLAFALMIAVATGLLFGLVPAWKASRADLNGMLRSRAGGSSGHAATRNSLVVVQLALSMALLASAGLITRSLMALQRVNPGFDGNHLLTAQFRLPVTKYDTPNKIWAMFEQSAAELRKIPGVEAAALVRTSPFSQNGDSYPVVVEGKPAVKPGDVQQMMINPITTGYFDTMRIPILLGHDITAQDRAGAPGVIVVNKSFADATWPGASPIGKRVKIGDEDWRTVIGVVGDTKQLMLNEHQLLEGYIPHAQRPQIFTSLVVRTKGNPLDYTKAVREAIWRVDRDQPIWRFRSMEQDLDAGVGSTKSMVWLTGLFAVVALVVAAIGIYGVLSYTMARRTQEVGIRIALGASATSVTRMVIGEGARLVAIAVAIGLVAAVGAARLLRSQLFGVQPNDLLTFAVVTVVLSAVAILACYVPARRASRVDPMVALRSE